MKKIIKSLIVAGSLAVAGTSANAQLLYDGFNYSAGNLAGNNGGTGSWNGTTSWAGGTENQVNTTGLTYTGLTTSGGLVEDTSASHTVTNASRGMGNQSSVFTDGSTNWFSFLIRPGATFTNWGFGIGNSAGATSGGFGLNVSSGNFTARAGATSSANTAFTWTSGTTFLVVGSMTTSTSGNETTTIWINPTIGGVSPVGGTSATVSGNIGTLPGATATMAFGGGNQAQVFAFDEVRFGTSFSSVTIPEPTTWALLAGSLTALVIFRRRRSA